MTQTPIRTTSRTLCEVASGSAAEHLHAFRTLVVDARVLQPQPGFTLMRAAIETTAGAVWLLNPPDRSTRVARALQHAATDAKDGDQVAQEAGADITTPLSDRIAGLQDVARAAGLAESVITTRPPGSATIIAYADCDILFGVSHFTGMADLLRHRPWSELAATRFSPARDDLME